MTVDPWSPDRYERFRSERSRPFFDLLALVRPRAGMSVVDLGCGTGDLTLSLHERLAARHTLGVDASASMLERAATLRAPGLRFDRGDIADFSPEEKLDLIFSNAALHWLPDHPRLIARLAGGLAPGGQIAFQIPANDGHPSHAIAHELAREAPFAAALGGFERRPAPLPPARYAELFHRLGFCAQAVRLEIYGHLLAGPQEVFEWVRATLLTDYERRLSGDLYARFLDLYRARLLERLPAASPYFYSYPRILAWAALPAARNP